MTRLSELVQGTAPPAKTGRLSEFMAPQEPAAPQGPAPAPLDLSQPTGAERIAGNPATRFALGAAGMVTGPFQLGANIGDYLVKHLSGRLANTLGIPELELEPVLGKAVNEYMANLNQMKERGMAAAQGVPEGEQSFDWAGLGGAVAVPTGAIANKSLLPGMTLATTRGGKIMEGMGIGGIFGATAPVTTGEDSTLGTSAENAVAGTVMGGAIPAGVGLVKGVASTARKTADLVTQGGAKRIADRYLDSVLPENRGALISALEKPEMLVPGSRPTAAEAVAHLPEGSVISAQQNITAKSPRDVSARFAARWQEQNRAREAAIGTIAKTEDKLTAAETSRSINAKKLYGDAYKQVVRADSELADVASNPFFKDALRDAMGVINSRKLNFKDNLLESMQVVKRSLDKMASKANEKPLGPEQLREVEKVKGALTAWMERKSPDYAAARAQFAKDSGPINRMKVGQVLRDKLVAPMASEGGPNAAIAQRSASYAQGMKDAPGTIKRGINFKYEKLSDVLTPEEVKTAETLAKELTRAKMAVTPLQRTSLPGGVDIASETTGRIPSMLSTPVVIINHAIKVLTGRGSMGIEARVDKVMGDYFLNPEQFADAIKRMTPPARSRALARYAAIVRNGGVAGAAIGNAQNQQDQPTE